MRILVNDVAAESGGALTILESFYARFCQDTSNDYVLCVSVPSLESQSNVEVLSFPWIKKSWFHRLWYECVTVTMLIRSHEIDEIFSLQNVATPLTRKPQTLYLHQPLPFEEKRFSLFESYLFWTYQKIIGPMIIRSAKRAKRIIVQTVWMRDAVMKTANLSVEKFEVQPPEFHVKIPGQFSAKHWERLFVYPATPLAYKNHKTLFKAMQILKKGGMLDYRVMLTIDERNLPKDCKGLIEGIAGNIEFLGSISHAEVMKLYCRAVLVFPSYIETYGLPLKEASLCGAPIICADRPFSREILGEYNSRSYFPPFDEKTLAECMRVCLENAPREMGNRLLVDNERNANYS